MNTKEQIRIAILDLYEGVANEGMRGIRQLIEEFEADNHLMVHSELFDVRLKSEVPDLDFDIYISTGGPGSPIDSEGSLWERRYFTLMDSIQQHNLKHPDAKKHVLLICHSFQIFCRYYGFGTVSKRKSTSFGVMPVHKTFEGHHDVLFRSLNDPLWAVDSRDYQITQPAIEKIEANGGSLLCIEKYRPHIDLERAVMAIRFTDAIAGVQFHPAADAVGMRMYLLLDDKRELVINRYGEQKYWNMLEHLNDPDKIMLTYSTVVPRFLMNALSHRLNSIAL
ncbi:MAG TPA: GMP synthase [Cytophagales bacterium]|nr:GMP synthase [Cytophagales bacterium]